MEHPGKRTVLYWLIAILLLALALRAGYCLLKTRVQKDAVAYLHMARDMAAGDSNKAFAWNPRIPPLYPFLMAVGARAGLGVEFCGRAISILSGVLLVIPVFLIARKFIRDRLALLSALLVATHPYLVRIGAEIMRDSLFMLLFFASIAFAVYATDPSWSRLWYPAGLFTGLSVLTRSEGMEVIVVMAVWICYELLLLLRERGGSSDADGAEGEETQPARSVWQMAYHYCGCFFGFMLLYLLVTVPVQVKLIKTPSTWSVVDTRIVSIVHDLFYRPKKEIVKQES